MTFVIGLTGGIGSGKSTVAEIFKSLGINIIDSDYIARELVEPGNPALAEICSKFGKEFLDEDGRLLRSKLREYVFSNNTARKQLEDILHPRIRQAMLERIASSSSPYCIAVIPLLLEQNWKNLVNRVLVVDTPEELQIQRTIDRDNMSRNSVRSILESQVTRQERLSKADDVIDNTGAIDDLKSRVLELHKLYLKLSAG